MTHIIDKILDRRRKHDHQRRRTTAHPPPPRSSNSSGGDNNNTNNNDTHNNNNYNNNNDIHIPLFHSFEFFPPKTEAGMDNLLTRIERMVLRLDPLFVDITFAAHSFHRTLHLATETQRYLGVDVLLHITCRGMTQSTLKQVLQQARGAGIHNLMVLRGDPPLGQTQWRPQQIVEDGDFPRAIDLVKWIKVEFGNAFGIAVAGHPEGQHSAEEPSTDPASAADLEVQHLRDKVEAGADFIVTQFFYNVQVFLNFVRRCRNAGIACPILPGILPIQSYTSFVRMTQYCGVSVPNDLLQQLHAVQTDDEAIKDIGCKYATTICQTILHERESLGLDGIHFYTLNLERSVTRILVDLGSVDLVRPPGWTDPSAATVVDVEGDSKVPASPTQLTDACFRTATGRPLPWRPSAMEKRLHTEQVRPINWANRPKSYVQRTEDWDEFPNGRWGDATSPAFGELSDLSHFYAVALGSDDDQRTLLGHNPSQPEDVFEVFARYVEGKVSRIPWCDTPLQAESFVIQNQLAQLNRAGFLTINSQPAVNGVSSSHPTFGWGGPNGYVYQKAYCECFCSPDRAARLVRMVQEQPQHSSLNLYAVNCAGEELRATGSEPGGVTALTWGVFPNREIVQPTVFDPNTFLVWAEEAFSLWSSLWLRLYDCDTDGYNLIESIRDTYYLCAIIDNDYVANHTGNAAATTGSSLWKAMLESS